MERDTDVLREHYKNFVSLLARRSSLGETEFISQLKIFRDDPNGINSIGNVAHDESLYPELGFSVTADELKSHFPDGTIGKLQEYVKKSDDPIVKLLYGLAWKQGFLKKLQLIADGIFGKPSKKGDRQVFRQFGRHLASGADEPIIDQHVFRAYELIKNNFHGGSDENTKQIFKRKEIKDPELTEEYAEWVRSVLGEHLQEALRVFDQIMFALGKAAARMRPKRKPAVAG